MSEVVEFEPQIQQQHHPRLFLRNLLSLHECRELEFIHKSSSTVGYRPNVFSTTLSHLIATNSSHFLIPFIPIRERLKDKLEEFFQCEYELFIEFTGLISWSRGASIGWHSDDNRPYLKQRHFSVVCYLNTYGKDFNGGLFHFQDGEPASIMPTAGDVVMYTADQCNIHSVDEVCDTNQHLCPGPNIPKPTKISKVYMRKHMASELEAMYLIVALEGNNRMLSWH